MAELALVATTEQPQVEHATFDDFWLLYPKRVARKDALAAWARMTGAERMDALTALVDWRRVWIARGDLQYAPHAATWLNGERWTDELPDEFVRTGGRPSAQVEYKPGEKGEKTAMPDKVREALAKLRGR